MPLLDPRTLGEITRKELSSRLIAVGVTESALEAILAETSEQRHSYRAILADKVAFAASRGRADHGDDYEITLVAWAILQADCFGIGGRGGVQGAATERIDALKGLGSGRKQAQDGGAWSSAISLAADRLGLTLLTFAPCDPTMSTPRLVIVPQEDGKRMGAECDVPFAVVPVAWQRTILREGLRLGLGLATWMGDDWTTSPTRALNRTAPPNWWAAALNHLPTAEKVDAQWEVWERGSAFAAKLAGKEFDGSLFEYTLPLPGLGGLQRTPGITGVNA